MKLKQDVFMDDGTPDEFNAGESGDCGTESTVSMPEEGVANDQ